MKLLDYLHQSRQTARAWAKTKALPKDGVYRHLKGRKVDYGTAKRISEATGGVVTIAEIME